MIIHIIVSNVSAFLFVMFDIFHPNVFLVVNFFNIGMLYGYWLKSQENNKKEKINQMDRG